VFGYTASDSYYLFDWKQGNQSSALEGFRLMKVNTASTSFWAENPVGVEVLASSYGNDLGWDDNREYQYSVGYTTNEITVSINGGAFDNQEIFNLNEMNNEAGRFGFYNLSQSEVRYRGNESELCTIDCGGSVALQNMEAQVPVPASFGLLCLGLVGLSARRNKPI